MLHFSYLVKRSCKSLLRAEAAIRVSATAAAAVEERGNASGGCYNAVFTSPVTTALVAAAGGSFIAHTGIVDIVALACIAGRNESGGCDDDVSGFHLDLIKL